MKNIRKDMPGLAAWIITKISLSRESTPILGDMEEDFRSNYEVKGRLYAQYKCWFQVFRSVFSFLKYYIYWSRIMFRNYLIVSLRNLKRNKGFSFINIFGLAFGLAISFILTFYVLDDLAYDRFHENADNIYRIASVSARNTWNSITAGPLVLKVKEDVPEIIASTRLTSFDQMEVGRGQSENTGGSDLNTVSGRGLITDPGFFDVFSFKILSGNTDDALVDPKGAYLTSEFAEALFGEEDPVGKPLSIRFLPDAYVAGIVETPPTTSHIFYELLIPLDVELNPVNWDSWENLALIGYVLLSDGADAAVVEEKMTKVARDNNFYELFVPRLQPLLDIHLGSADYYYDRVNSGKNDTVVVIALGTIGIVVLLIACFNFINLSTAQAAKRAREVGMRKVAGANKRQLSIQFIGESVLIALVSFLFAMVIVQLVAPFLGTILNKQLSFNIFERASTFSAMFGITVILGILSGLYPTFVISSFNPVTVLKGELRSGSSGVFMRRLLIIMQFGITISLVIAVLSVYNQIEYIKSLNLGYDRNRLIAIPSFFRSGDDLLSERLAELPEITAMGRISALPGPNFYRVQIIPEGTDREKSYTASRMYIDEKLFDSFSISLAEGRNFSKEFALDTLNNVIVNRTLAEKAGWKDPIGKNLDIVDAVGTAIPHNVIGVIDDFHYLTPRQAVEPMVFLCNWREAFFLTARLDQSAINEILPKIEEKFKEIFPERELRITFLDELFDSQFESDRSFAENIGIFSGIAIFIACLGLIGLASYSIEQRRKEIVIRKILGSRRNEIVMLLTSDFLKWVVLANLLAWPAGYYAIQIWLNEFAYKMPFSITPFILAGAGALLIAFLTIFYQTLKVASSNPTDSLQYE
ncbi:ABC transporter permease [candidate division KSB1 bacterium]